jgi:hypothetical protein
MPSVMNARLNGREIQVGVCWPQATTDAAHAQYKDGVVDLDHLVPLGQGPGSQAEREHLRASVQARFAAIDAAAEMPLRPTPTPVRVSLDGREVTIPICWSKARVDQLLKLYPNGAIDLEKMVGPGTPPERAWLIAAARNALGKEDRQAQLAKTRSAVIGL